MTDEETIMFDPRKVTEGLAEVVQIAKDPKSDLLLLVFHVLPPPHRQTGRIGHRKLLFHLERSVARGLSVEIQRLLADDSGQTVH